MTAPERSLGSHPPAAGVQFYEDDDLLCASVAHYLGAGLAVGERVLVIATEPHWQAIDAVLGGNAFDVQRAMKAGRLIFREARETLAKLMGGGMPDRRLFRELLDTLLADVGSQVRAYGEMVDVLWKDGNLPAALRLEELWSELCEERSLPLLCAYVMGPTAGAGPRPETADVLGTGRHAFPAEQPTRLDTAEAQMREIGLLQQRARALENEIGQRKQLETALREALEDRERLLAEVETDRARLAESEGRQIVQRKRLELLQSITASFARALKPRDVAAVIVDEGTAALGATRGGIWLLAGNGRSLELVRSTGYSARTLEQCSRLPFDSLVPVARCYAARTQLWLESRALCGRLSRGVALRRGGVRRGLLVLAAGRGSALFWRVLPGLSPRPQVHSGRAGLPGDAVASRGAGAGEGAPLRGCRAGRGVAALSERGERRSGGLAGLRRDAGGGRAAGGAAHGGLGLDRHGQPRWDVSSGRRGARRSRQSRAGLGAVTPTPAFRAGSRRSGKRRAYRPA